MKQSVLSSEKLGGSERPLAFLSTDKPIYKPGETIYVRAVALQSDNYFPLNPTANMLATLKLFGPRGNELARLNTQLTNSTAGFSWVVPEGLAGGRYKASVSVTGSPEAVRDFEIRVYTPLRLKSQIEFAREGYGPGDEVSAHVKVTRAEGGIPAGSKVVAIARVDNHEVARVDGLTVNSDGECQASFKLPTNIERGEGTLAFIIEDGGVSETASKTIPILLQTLDLNFYPEGGELVADLPGRVYVQAFRPDGKPADIKGDIIKVDAKGQAITNQAVVVALSTEHEGRGRFEFTPKAKEHYALRISQPSGLTRLFPLPAVHNSGVSIRAEKDSYTFEEPITLTIQATPDSGAAKLTIYHREHLAAQADLATGKNKITVNPGEAEGVLMATVWSKDGQPLAERLVFRQPKFNIQVTVKAETIPTEGVFSPGGRVRLTVTTQDKNGQPVESVVGLAVTDETLLEMQETRDQAPSLPVMVYLENEVNELADAHVYFDQVNPHAGRDIDLLLGTQGWRRFILVRMDDTLKANPDAVRRALAIRQSVQQPHRFEDLDVRKEQVLALQQAPAAMPVLMAVEDEKAIPPMEMQVMRDEIHAIGMAEPMEVNERKRMPEVVANMEMRELAAPRVMPMITIREYAHSIRQNRKPNDRLDFTETLYWNAGLRTNPRNGTATVEFGLSDSITTFRVLTDAFGNNGAIGATRSAIISAEPFYAEAKLPQIVLAGDKIVSPVAMVNATDKPLSQVKLTFRVDKLNIELGKSPSTLEPNQRARVLLNLTPDQAGEYGLTLNAVAGPYTDTVTRQLKVLSRGFPVALTASGLVSHEKPFRHKFTIDEDLLPGSLTAAVKVYPTPLANMEEALNALLRQPHGCFEQTSSTSYPLVMAQQYFTTHTGVSADKIKQADRLLDESYKKLINFESSEKGYEWFGENPGHEALTAYGLMQFTEMKQVRPVDDEMLKRTQTWLMSRRDGNGGFKRNEKALDSFGGAPAPVTNLYILWTLLESGQKSDGLKTEIEAAKKVVASSNDPYLLALGTNILYLAGDTPAAKAAATSLQKIQAKDGSLKGAETSITRSAGESLLIETTSLTIIGWLRCGDAYAGSVENSMAWLFKCCKTGRFGSTQSTILALKAINAYDAARSHPKAPGSLQLVIDGKPLGKPLNFDEKTQGALELPDFSASLTPGEHTIEIAMTNGGEMPFALEITYNTPKPANSPDCPLTLATSLSTHKIAEGEPVDLTVTLQAKEADVPMPLAIIGLPAGLDPRHERLKELIKDEQIAAYEIKGRELVLYWRNLKAEQKIIVSVPLIAAIPGSYTAPASRVYGYYLEEHKNWQAGEAIEITPR